MKHTIFTADTINLMLSHLSVILISISCYLHKNRANGNDVCSLSLFFIHLFRSFVVVTCLCALVELHFSESVSMRKKVIDSLWIHRVIYKWVAHLQLVSLCHSASCLRICTNDFMSDFTTDNWRVIYLLLFFLSRWRNKNYRDIVSSYIFRLTIVDNFPRSHSTTAFWITCNERKKEKKTVLLNSSFQFWGCLLFCYCGRWLRAKCTTATEECSIFQPTKVQMILNDLFSLSLQYFFSKICYLIVLRRDHIDITM